MSHNVETMAYAGETPWHGLGVSVGNDLSAQEMLVAAGLDWQVGKYSTYVRIRDKTITTGQKALIRLSDNKVLSPMVGPDWEPTQNQEAFDFFKEFIDEGNMTMETAGSLREGQIVWVLAKVGEGFEVFGGDRVESYLMFSNSHMYGKTTVVDFTPIRVVCNNTLTLALRGKSKNAVSLNHRSKFDPTRVKEMLGIAHAKLDTYKESAEFLGSRKITEEEKVEFFKTLWPVNKAPDGKEAKKDISRLAKAALEHFETQPGAEFAEGTWWQAFNAVTYMADHVLSKEQDTRLYNSWFGYVKDKKLEALALALDGARAA